MSSMWGKNIKLSIFGESHGNCVGITINGIPAGTEIDLDYINNFLDKRRAKNEIYSTSRCEADMPEIISGVYAGCATGSPITSVFKNNDINSKVYNVDIIRPSHADYPAFIKYSGFNDARGGGHFSGRLTAPLCFAGAICSLVLKTYDITCVSHINSIYDICDDSFNPTDIPNDLILKLKNSNFPLINEKIKDVMLSFIKSAKMDLDSIGGSVECAITGVSPGVGEPFFASIESHISSLLFSIPAVKAVEFGAGTLISTLKGSAANDEYYIDNGKIKTNTNNNGGILGGLSTGMPIIARAFFKPTASIPKPQRTVNIKTRANETLCIKGRHDSCIVPRATICVESACAIAILDLLLEKRKNDR